MTYLHLNSLSLNPTKSKLIVFVKKKRLIHTMPIPWDGQKIEIVPEWKCLGITINRLRKIDSHIRNLKSAINSKQYALILNLGNKKLNNQKIHIKLFNALIRSAYIYATPARAWTNQEKLESIKYQYFRRLLPTYLHTYSTQNLACIHSNLLYLK